MTTLRKEWQRLKAENSMMKRTIRKLAMEIVERDPYCDCRSPASLHDENGCMVEVGKIRDCPCKLTPSEIHRLKYCKLTAARSRRGTK